MASQPVASHVQYTFIVDRVVPRQRVPRVVPIEKPVRQLVRELPGSEQPVHRFQHYGPGALSSMELIAAVLQTPDALSLAGELVSRFQNLDGIARATTAELCTVDGIGPARAIQLQAALALGRRWATTPAADRHRVTSPADAASLVTDDMSRLEQEQLRVILLDTKNHVVGITTVYQGNVNTAIVRSGELLRDAVRHNCPALILVHNHPSGDATPSPEDVQVTRHVREAGQLLDIDVLDHIIVGRGRWVSLKERGLGFD
jgi:DNA repair protein RadC